MLKVTLQQGVNILMGAKPSKMTTLAESLLQGNIVIVSRDLKNTEKVTFDEL